MSAFVNQNNVFLNGTLISGVSALTTGTPVRVQGLGKFSIAIEGLNTPNFTATIQTIVHPSQTSWANLVSTGFNGNNGAALFQTIGQFDTVRVVVNPYLSGNCNVWFSASQS